MDTESTQFLDGEKRSLHQRLILEFSAGIVICGLGTLVLIGSFLKRFENGLRHDISKPTTRNSNFVVLNNF